VSARIVVADDEVDILRLVEFTLRRRGYLITAESAGDRALATIRRDHPDLVVLDVMMPGLSGLAVARALADDAATADIPVVLLSARGQVSEIQAGRRSGARVYLVKPFVPRELAACVANLLADRVRAPATAGADGGSPGDA
jgi:DNA-binding response OmpR family regulator